MKLSSCLIHILWLALAGFILVQPAVAQSKAYRIGPRDILTLTIFAGGEEQQKMDVTVSSEGMVNVPLVGPVRAQGLTSTQLEQAITEPLARDYFVDPQVHIQVKGYHSLEYYISGAVKTPGSFEMTTEATLMELIAKAGGVLPERGNVAYVMRETPGATDQDKKEPIKVDLKRLLDQGDMASNLDLEPGDVVYIPLEKALDQGASKVYVEGEVKSPGMYDYQPGLTALNACIMAGGFTTFAAPNRASIIRQSPDGQKVMDVDLEDVKEGKQPDIPLEPGDRVHVPQSWL